MRWFVVFLLLANLVLYLWVAYGESPRPALDLPPPDIGRLPLLHEAQPPAAVELAAASVPAAALEHDNSPPPRAARGPEAGGAAEPVDAGDARPPPDATTITPPAEGPVAPVTDAGTLAGGPVATSQPAASGTPVDAPAGETTSATAGAVGVPVEQPGVVRGTGIDAAPEAPLQEAAESPAGSATDGVMAAVVAPSAAEPPAEPAAAAVGLAAVERCLRIGPLSIEEAEAFRGNATGTVEVVDEERREIAVVDGYYVLIPPLASREEGNRKLDELSAAGVKDTWLFRAGELRNAISLGYFKREASARRHADNVRSLGFETEVREKSVQAQRLWLLVAGPSTPADRDVTESAPAGASIEPVDCPAQ